MEYRSLYIVTRNEEEAKIFGRTLVAEKLIACANFFPIQSIYRWKNNIEESVEIALIAKTRRETVDLVIERVKQLHSYEVPCGVSWAIEKGNTDYLDWIKETTEQG